MSLSILPEELIMKIMGYLLDPDICEQKDYMNFAMTCKRFFQIAETRFYTIKQDNSETNELAVLHTITVYHPDFITYQQHYDTNFCSNHEDGWLTGIKRIRRRSKICYKNYLSAALSNKHSIARAIRFVGYDFNRDYCLMTLDDSKFDNIVELVLIQCNFEVETFESLLLKLKNVTRLHIASPYDETIYEDIKYHPTIERVMDYIFIDHDNFYLLHKFKLPAKKLVTARYDYPAPIHSISRRNELNLMLARYLKTYEDIIEVAQVDAIYIALFDDLRGLRREMRPAAIAVAKPIQRANGFRDMQDEFNRRCETLIDPKKWPQFLTIDLNWLWEYAEDA